MQSEPMRPLAVKLPGELIRRYDVAAGRAATQRAVLIREALELYITLLDSRLCVVNDTRAPVVGQKAGPT